MIRWKEEEKQVIIEMRQRLALEIRKIPQFPEVVGDRRLLRFYHGNGRNIDHAVEGYKKFLKWRKENQVDSIRQDIVYGKANSPMKFPSGEKIIDIAPQIVMTANAVDKENQPIILEKYDFSPKHFVENIKIDEYLLFLIYCLEYRILILEQLSDKYERLNMDNILNDPNTSDSTKPYGVIMRFCNIRDLKGVNIGHLGHDGRTIVTSALKMALPNYPDMLGVAYHVNCPWIFKASWNFVKKFLDEDIIRKIQISSANYMEVLEAGISIENIPLSIGGKFELYNEPYEFDRSKEGPLYYEGAPNADDMTADDNFDFLPSPTIHLPRAILMTDEEGINSSNRTIVPSSYYEDSKDNDAWGYVPSNEVDADGRPKPYQRISPVVNPISAPVVIIYPNTAMRSRSKEEMKLIWISGLIIVATVIFIYLYS